MFVGIQTPTNCGHRADGGDLYPNWLPARSQLRGAGAQKILLTPDF